MSTLEKPTPQTYEPDAPAQQAGIFLASESHSLADLIPVGEALPPLNESDNPLAAVRHIGRLAAIYGEGLKISVTPGGETIMHVTETAFDDHVNKRSEKVNKELEKIYGSAILPELSS